MHIEPIVTRLEMPDGTIVVSVAHAQGIEYFDNEDGLVARIVFDGNGLWGVEDHAHRYLGTGENLEHAELHIMRLFSEKEVQ